MGCGASKNAEAVVAPPQEKSSQSLKQAAANGLPDNQVPSRINSTTKNACVSDANAGPKAGDLGASAASFTKPEQPRASSPDGLSKPHPQKLPGVVVVADTLPCEPVSSAEGPVPATAADRERPSSASEAELESPTRAAFRSRMMGASATEGQQASPVAFRSSRSLNRSIGVRRRISDQGRQGRQLQSEQEQQQQWEAEAAEQRQQQQMVAGQEVEPPAQAAAVDARLMYDDDDEAEEDEDMGPDPLREQFELTKESNPLLVVGRKSTGNGILSCKHSEKSLKSHKRLMVGFALEGGAEWGGVGVDVGRPASSDSGRGSAAETGTGTGTAAVVAGLKRASTSESGRDLDPGQHLEAERIASVSAPPPEEAPAPMVIVRGAAS